MQQQNFQFGVNEIKEMGKGCGSVLDRIPKAWYRKDGALIL